MSTARVPSITSPLQDSFFLSNCLPSLNLQRLLWVLFCLVLSETVDSDYRLSPLSALQSVYDALFNSLLYSKRDERRNEGRKLPCRVVLWVGGCWYEILFLIKDWEWSTCASPWNGNCPYRRVLVLWLLLSLWSSFGNTINFRLQRSWKRGLQLLVISHTVV